MAALLKKIIRWWTPTTLLCALRTGQIARGLVQLKSVGCPTRINGRCAHEQELFGCADCMQEEANRQPPGTHVRGDALN